MDPGQFVAPWEQQDLQPRLSPGKDSLMEWSAQLEQLLDQEQMQIEED